jgi:predicted transposase/invertase (TIGR01784 family)
MIKASRFLSPKSDVIFKKIFGSHPAILKSFLNAVMPLPEGVEIDHLEYLTPEEVPIIPEFKRSIVDVKCYDKSGTIFVIEMQMNWSASFNSRMLYGCSKAYVNQLESGRPYKELCDVYGLALVDGVFDPNPNEYYHHYKMTKVADTTKYLKGMEIVFVELPKFNFKTFQEKKLRDLWLRFLNETENMLEIPQELQEEKEIVDALELSQEAALTKEELAYYESYMDAIRTEKTLMADKFEEGIEIGGERERLKALKEKKAMVKLMFLEGSTIEFIQKVTKLDLKTISELIKE